MDYSIGQVSRLLGLSIEGIRNYEKSGIITSRREQDSNYRKYTYLDIAALIRARMYRSYGYTIKETGALINERSMEEILESLRKKENELGQEILMLQEKQQHLRELEQNARNVGKKAGHVEIAWMPAIYRIEFSHNGQIDFSPDTVSVFQKWMEFTPFIYMSSRYHGADVYGGLAIREEHGKLFQMEQMAQKTSLIRHLDSALCLKLTVMEGDTGHSRTETLTELKEYAKKHCFEMDDDMIGHTIMGIHKNMDYQRFREVYVRIRE